MTDDYRADALVEITAARERLRDALYAAERMRPFPGRDDAIYAVERALALAAAGVVLVQTVQERKRRRAG